MITPLDDTLDRLRIALLLNVPDEHRDATGYAFDLAVTTLEAAQKPDFVFRTGTMDVRTGRVVGDGYLEVTVRA
jgi:hypothetical protein